MIHCRANERRTARADAALRAYGSVAVPDIQRSPEELLIDLLTDLRHWCAANKLDFPHAVKWSETHYKHEK